jgi:regulator of protease activity HflC (stomatin/prohibitin superfamily)
MPDLNVSVILAIIFTAFLLVNLFLAIKVIRQGENALVERFGKYTKTLEPGLNLLIPFIEKVSHRVDMRQQRIPFTSEAYTADGSPVSIACAIVWRVTDPAHAYYRDQSVGDQLLTQGGDYLRSAVGKMELEALNSSRDALKTEISEELQRNATDLGVAVTSFAILEVQYPDNIDQAMTQQYTAEMDKRVVMKAADGELYKATKEAEALKITSEARSYELATIAQVIAEHGKATIDYDIAIKQVKAMSDIGSSESTKSVILPTNITESLGTIETVLEYLRDRGSVSAVKPDINPNNETQVQKDPPAKDPDNSSDDQVLD